MNTKPRLKYCERADHANPSLKCNYGDGHEVRNPEPSCIDPLPAPCVAEQDKDQPADDEQDDGSMKNEDEISERLVHDGLRL